MSNFPTWSVRDLYFRYRPKTPELFRGLTWDFTPGVMTALTGPSGTGKSTLLYLLGLLLKPTAGQVIYEGAAVSQGRDAQSSHLRATRIGFVFQDSQLDPTRSVVDCVAEPGMYAGMSLSQARPHARELLERFGLAEVARSKPTQISGGQAQRAAVCRAFQNSPGLVLADEPTGNLDRGNAELVLQALAEAAGEGRTVVIATHDPFVLGHVGEVLSL